MTVFEQLDDHRPPEPTPEVRAAVRRRARQLVVRRRLLVAVPLAVLALVVAVGLSAVSGSSPGGRTEVAGSGSTTTTSPVDPTRGEVLDVAADRSEATVESDRVRNDPASGRFERALSIHRPDGSQATVRRSEVDATGADDLAAGFGRGVSTSPAGREYQLDPDDPGRLLWFPTDGIAVVVELDSGQDPVEVLDALDYEAPDERCVADGGTRSTGPCAALDLELR